MVGVAGTASQSVRPDSEELREQYEAYRRRQARRLLRILPKEAVRPLYRRALGRDGPRDAADPLAALTELLGSLLPLPPFETWLDDLTRHPEAHLQDLDDSAEAPTAAAPTTVETLRFEYEGRPWRAHLRSFRDGAVWRGFIAFEDEPRTGVHRTALIFREADPVGLRERFMAFESMALGAFLRSALP